MEHLSQYENHRKIGPSCPPRRVVVQGWESECGGVDGFPWLTMKKFQTFKVLDFLVSSFLDFLASSCFSVPSFQILKDPKINLCFRKPLTPYYNMSIHACERYLFHIAQFRFHVGNNQYWNAVHLLIDIDPIFKICEHLLNGFAGYLGPRLVQHFQQIRFPTCWASQIFLKWMRIFVELFGASWCLQR